MYSIILASVPHVHPRAICRLQFSCPNDTLEGHAIINCITLGTEGASHTSRLCIFVSTVWPVCAGWTWAVSCTTQDSSFTSWMRYICIFDSSLAYSGGMYCSNKNEYTTRTSCGRVTFCHLHKNILWPGTIVHASIWAWGPLLCNFTTWSGVWITLIPLTTWVSKLKYACYCSSCHFDSIKKRSSQVDVCGLEKGGGMVLLFLNTEFKVDRLYSGSSIILKIGNNVLLLFLLLPLKTILVDSEVGRRLFSLTGPPNDISRETCQQR